MYELVEALMDEIGKRNIFQHNILEQEYISDDEKKQLDKFLDYNVSKRGRTIESLADAYLFVINMAWEETYYFLEYGRYRNNSYKDVAESVYGNKDYMDKYMTGLSIIDYLMISHLKMIRYFEKNLKTISGVRYLEIGPGAGQLLVAALEHGHFNEYNACDISETSVELSNDYLGYLGYANVCKVEKKDFFEYNSDEKFDCIVMGEVLEHVEKPQEMLTKIYDLLENGGIAYITTVINTPTLDHIYLFSNKDEVLEMAEKSKFIVKDYMLATAGDISLDKAERKKRAINIAMVLSKE